MKVLIASDWYEPVINGVTTSVKNLSRELTNMGHDVRILTLDAGREQVKREGVWYFPSIGVGAVYPNARLSLMPCMALMDEIRQWSPDIIHTQCEFSTFLYAKRVADELDIPIVHTYHTVYEDYTHYFSPAKVWGKKAVRWFTRLVCNRVSAVIAPSDKTKNILRGYGIAKPISVIPSGINLQRFGEIADDKKLDALRKKLGIENKRVCLFLGRMAKEKNCGELIEYFNNTSSDDTVLLMVGGGPYIEELQALAASLPCGERVIFTGMVEPKDTPLYYRLGDVFVCASKSETQGMTYAEALASGLPCLCRKDLCISGVIIDSVNGWQYETQAQFEACLKRVLYDGDLRAALSQNAPKAAQRYDSRTFAAKVESVYRSALADENLEAIA